MHAGSAVPNFRYARWKRRTQLQICTLEACVPRALRAVDRTAFFLVGLAEILLYRLLCPVVVVVGLFSLVVFGHRPVAVPFSIVSVSSQDIGPYLEPRRFQIAAERFRKIILGLL